jgi:hypothetical protein
MDGTLATTSYCAEATEIGGRSPREPMGKQIICAGNPLPTKDFSGHPKFGLRPATEH